MSSVSGGCSDCNAESQGWRGRGEAEASAAGMLARQVLRIPPNTGAGPHVMQEGRGRGVASNSHPQPPRPKLPSCLTGAGHAFQTAAHLVQVLHVVQEGQRGGGVDAQVVLVKADGHVAGVAVGCGLVGGRRELLGSHWQGNRRKSRWPKCWRRSRRPCVSGARVW